MENNKNLEQYDNQIEGEENNNIDLNNKVQSNINYKGEMEDREELQNQSQEQNPEIEQEGEGEEEVQQVMEEGGNEEVEQEGGEEEGGVIYDNNYNNYRNNNKKMSNKERMELINNKLKLNLNAKKKQKINNNIHENIINDDKEINFENINLDKKNNILSDLLDKIKNFKNNRRNMGTKLNLNSNNNFDALDKELANALEKLNNKNNKINDIPNANILNEEPKVDRQYNRRNVLRNPKFKEIISLINEKDIKRSNKYSNIGNYETINFMNTKIKYNNNFADINIFVPKKNNAINLLDNMTYNTKIRKNNNDKYYISCIDGKAIVNGMRKEIPFLSKFNNNDNRFIINNNNNSLNNFNFTFGKSTRRDNSVNLNKNIKTNEFNYGKSLKNKKYNKNSGLSDLNFNKIKNDFSKENLSNKLNKMNDCYFQREFKFFK